MGQNKMKVSAILFIAISKIYAQETIPATGHEAMGSGGSVSYSVGQMVYSTATGTNGSSSQGVQQSYEISVVSGIEEANGISLQYSVYPNPATDCLTLKVENFIIEDLFYRLYSLEGKLLINKKLESNTTSILVENLVPAIYFLKIIASNKEVKTFKIIRN